MQDHVKIPLWHQLNKKSPQLHQQMSLVNVWNDAYQMTIKQLTTRRDIGHLILKIKLDHRVRLSDAEIRYALERRWIPKDKSEFPCVISQ